MSLSNSNFGPEGRERLTRVRYIIKRDINVLSNRGLISWLLDILIPVGALQIIRKHKLECTMDLICNKLYFCQTIIGKTIQIAF